MLVSDFDYHLPEDLIAQEPLADRAASRMLHLDRATGGLEDTTFREFPEILRSDDLVVLNNTRVFAARLFGHRSGQRSQPLSRRNPASKDFLHGKVEVLLASPVSAAEREGHGFSRAAGDSDLLERGFSRAENATKKSGALAPEVNPLTWNALVRPGRKIGIGEKLFFGDHEELHAEVIARGEFGERTLKFDPVEDFFGIVERVGHVPLPPYIAREDRIADRQRYQTVYARQRGSVAAPTAGLHFTPEVLARLHERGIETAEITLHVGLGTFQPVHTEVVEEHKLHREWFQVTSDAAKKINTALDDRRRVVAVGTTSVRTLEYCARNDGRIHAGEGEADLFIYPGFQFRVIGAMLTNFHLPKSTLLMLVSAFAGRERVLAAYHHAVEQRYRFYSYGDCMFIE